MNTSNLFDKINNQKQAILGQIYASISAHGYSSSFLFLRIM